MKDSVQSRGRVVLFILYGLCAAIGLAIISFIVWAETPLGPGRASLAALESGADVTVTNVGGWTEFTPAHPVSLSSGGAAGDTGFVFYPGGRVDWRSYAPVLSRIAAKGCLVIVTPVRLNLAFLDIDAAKSPLAAHPEIRTWAIGGHSLGGVAASLFAEKNPELISGIVFWASYPSDSGLLEGGSGEGNADGDNSMGRGFRILSVSASKDGLATPEKIAASRANLPSDTIFSVIEGGNHGGFGDYGPQKGDNPAEITAEDQWRQTAEATAAFLGTLR